MRRLHSLLPANVMVKLYYSLVYSHLTYALLAWWRSGRVAFALLRLSVKIGTCCISIAKIECAHKRARKLFTDCNQTSLTFHSIYGYFVQVFNTNSLNFHQYLTDKLFSHQPTHMHNAWHRKTVLLILQYLIIQKKKLFVLGPQGNVTTIGASEYIWRAQGASKPHLRPRYQVLLPKLQINNMLLSPQ